MKYAVGIWLAFGLAVPANAEWKGFDWGMSEAQVEGAESDIAVYKLETVKRRKTYPSYSTLGGTWSDDGHDYQLYFYFDQNGKLRDIEFEPLSLECSAQNDAFAERFGEYEEDVTPLGSAQRITRRWRLGKAAELLTIVLHFPKTDTWLCTGRIKEPVGR